jgi:LmbE family N-acetylglucosaminyl deacetylase
MTKRLKFKNLVISPHLDDEVLGCFSILGPETFVLYCGSDESMIVDPWVRKRPSKSDRIIEMNKVARLLKFKYKILDNKVNYYSLNELISSFEFYINEIKPEFVYIPNPSYNQDHRAVYEAMLTALRPHDVNFFVKKVLIYEQIQDLWNQNYHTFSPIYFIPIDVNKKIDNYLLYKSQVRNFRSSDMIESLARLRGAQSNLEYSEAFEILRWID